jgi:hypothetical protein
LNSSQALQWAGIELDVVGRGPQKDKPDRAPDACFILRQPYDNKTISEIILRRLKPNGKPTREIWRSRPHTMNWILGVIVDGVRKKPDRQGELSLKVESSQEIHLYASDSWSPSNWFERGQIYQALVIYKSGEEFTTPDITIE